MQLKVGGGNIKVLFSYPWKCGQTINPPKKGVKRKFYES